MLSLILGEVYNNMTGILVWVITIIISAMTFLLVNRLLSKHLANITDSRKSLIAIILSAIVGDLLVHIIIIVDVGFSEMMMWAPVSIPFVGLCLVITSFIMKAMYEWKKRRL